MTDKFSASLILHGNNIKQKIVAFLKKYDNIIIDERT